MSTEPKLRYIKTWYQNRNKVDDWLDAVDDYIQRAVDEGRTFTVQHIPTSGTNQGVLIVLSPPAKDK
jgi:hypothetical protein